MPDSLPYADTACKSAKGATWGAEVGTLSRIIRGMKGDGGRGVGFGGTLPQPLVILGLLSENQAFHRDVGDPVQDFRGDGEGQGG